MQAPPVITDPGDEYGSNMRRFQGIPGFEVTKKGRLWALWYAGGPMNRGKVPGTTR